MLYQLRPPLCVAAGGSVMRIGENPAKSVVFFGVEGLAGIEYGGTGFLVCDKDAATGIEIPFLVTCRHVAELLSKHPEFFIRLNTRGGSSENVAFEKIEWFFHPDKTVDIAATFILIQPAQKFDLMHLRIHEEPFLAIRQQTSCGDLISVIGLFRLHAGSQRNVPFVHNGHIAVLPDEKERVPLRDRITGEVIETEVYLVEAQTLDGLSGSPVFLHEILEFGEPQKGQARRLFGNVRLLGIYNGSWDGEPGVILAADRDLRGNKRVPVGVGTVIPIEKVIELIRGDASLKKTRDAFVQVMRSRLAASQDTAIPSREAVAPPSVDANPTHREDFMRLVGAAAQKREQED